MTAKPPAAELPDARFVGLAVTRLPGGLGLIHATTLGSRTRGLSGLGDLDPSWGLEIPTRSVHTFTMRFGLDLIWRDGSGAVLAVNEQVRRWQIRSCLRAASVIEVQAGAAERWLAALRTPAGRA